MKTLILVSLALLFTQIICSQEVRFQTGHTNDILKVKFSPDDSQLISYSAGDGRLCLWDVKSGHLLWMAKTEFIQKAKEHYNLQEFYWSVNNKTLVSKSMNGSYQTWDARTGEILSVSDSSPQIALVTEKLKRISVTKDYRNFYLQDKRTGEKSTIKNFSRTGDVFDVSHNGTLFAEGGSWGNAAIKITQTRTGESRFLSGHPGIVRTIAYSPNGDQLAVAGNDYNIYIFDASKHVLTKTLIGHAESISSVAFSPDGKLLLSASADQLIKVWDWQKGSPLHDIKLGRGVWDTKKIEFSKDGKYFLTLEEDTLRIWDAQTWRPLREMKTAESYEDTGGRMTYGYSTVPCLTATFTSDGARIISSHADGTLRTWDTSSGKQLMRFDIGKEIPFFLVTPDSRKILAAIGRSDEFQIKLLNAKDGKQITKFDDEDASYIEAFSISPNGRNFATSDISGDVLLWDINEIKPIRQLDIGYSGYDSIAFSPDGKTLAVGGGNQNLFLFDVKSGVKLWQLLPSYQPGELELRLAKEKKERLNVLEERAAIRDKQAAIDTEIFKKQVYITFEHYGDMTDPGEQRMLEPGEPNKSKVKKSPADSNAVWLRLHNESPLPISIPTQSMYLPNPRCFHTFPGGQKLRGLCDGREISIWFSLEDKDGKEIPYGFDFGSSAILLPKTSVVFGVPRATLRGNNAIRFGFRFQKETSENTIAEYGRIIILQFRESELPREP